MATGNSIIGIFSNPILSGNSLNTPPGSGTIAINNGATAVTSGSGTSTLNWGTTDGQAPTTGTFSSLTFTGSTNLALNATSPVTVGTITFYNGTSSTDTIIFGATLSLYFNTVSDATRLGTDTVYISSTANTFTTTGLTQSQLKSDADFVSICGNSSNICGSSIESFESSEVTGYQPFVAVLNALYLGDPSITLTSVTAAPGSSSSGEIGAQAEIVVPEPASLALLLAGVTGMGAVVAVRRRRADIVGRA